MIRRRKTIAACRPQRPRVVANDDPQEMVYVPMLARDYAIVTDRWFDPIYGQSEESAGQMVGLQFYAEGMGIGTKWSHNLLGLARAGWHYATPEEVGEQAEELARTRRLRQAMRDGEVTPITTMG